MTYLAFSIRKKYKFHRNVFEREQLDNTSNFSLIENYYKAFENFIKVFILLKHKYRHKKDDLKILRTFLRVYMNLK